MSISTETAEVAAPTSKSGQGTWQSVKSFTEHRLRILQAGYLDGASSAKAELARLRNADPTIDARIIEIWISTFSDAPATLIGRGDEPTPAERAVATALHLYAIHQQSRGEAQHVSGVSVGTAVQRLIRTDTPDNRERPVMRHYHTLIAATAHGEIVQHLRSIVQQFRAEGIPLDYSKLAADLYMLSFPDRRTRVRLSWSRDLIRPSQQVMTTDPVDSSLDS